MPTDYNASDIYKNRWLKAEHLDGDSQVVTILDVTAEAIGEKKEMKFILKFREFEKELVLNATNAKVLMGLFGDIPNSWINKRVTLYVMDVQFNGKIMPAIRINSRLPKESAPAAAPAQEPAKRTEAQIKEEISY